MKVHPNANRVLLLCLPAAVLACSLADNFLPPAITPPAPAAAEIPEPAAMGTAERKPTATPSPTFSPTAPCVLRTGSGGLQTIQDDVDGLVPGATVVWFDDFACGTLDPGWGTGGANPTMQISVAGGVVKIHAREYKDVWEGLGRTEPSLRDGMGYLVLFRFENGTTGNLALFTGVWQTPSNRSWMLAIKYETAQIAVWEGWEGTAWMSNNFPYSMLRSGEWYYLLLRLGNAGELSARVWEKDRPDNQTEFRRNMKQGWAGLDWTALFQVYKGTIEIDRYLEVSF
ncbi:MAG: hypothetical protein JW748_06895 [Anaerolineales bacterium]|nr:hypothetical protein [Anaerolineales bacterium]